ncbi:MAG: tubulin-like doman-containing protein [Acidimicrobiales bacterium]
MAKPTLIVGCGGSGHQAVEAAHDALAARLARAGWRQGIPRAWQFLTIDSPNHDDDGDVAPVRRHAVQRIEVAPGRTRFDDHLRVVIDRTNGAVEAGRSLAGWLPEHDPGSMPALGSGQRRDVGRVLVLSQAHEIVAALERAWREATSLQASTELSQVAALLGLLMPGAVGRVDAYVVSSIAGGLGSACFQDVARLLRSTARFPVDVRGLLFTSQVHRAGLQIQAAPGLEGNTLAALCELVAGQDPRNEADHLALAAAALVPPQRPAPILDQTYLITGDSGSSMFTREELLLTTGGIIAQVLGRQTAHDALEQGLLAEPPQTVDPTTIALGTSQGSFSSLGAARISLGHDELRTYCIDRLVEEATLALHPRTDGSDADEPTAEDVERFLAASDLLVPDGEGTLGLPIHGELRSIARDAAASTVAQVVDRLRWHDSPSRDWPARVAHAVEAEGPAIRWAASDRTRASIQAWAANLPAKVRAATADECAAQGWEGAARTVAAAERALLEAVERSWHSRDAAAKIADSKSGDLGARRWLGRLTKSAQATQQLVREAGAIVEMHARADAHGIVAAVLRECHDMLLVPLAGTLSATPDEDASRVPGRVTAAADPTTIVLGGTDWFAQVYETIAGSTTTRPWADQASAAHPGAIAAVLDRAMATEEAFVWRPACAGGDGGAPGLAALSPHRVREVAQRWVDEVALPAIGPSLSWQDRFSGPPHEAALALEAFRRAIRDALDRARPLARIDRSACFLLHGVSSYETSTVYVDCPFVTGHPAASIVAEECRASDVHCVPIYAPRGTIGGRDLEVLTRAQRLAPSAFPDVFAPIRARLHGPATSFWGGRRAASSASSLPISSEARGRLLRGATVASVLGALRWSARDGSAEVLGPAGDVVGLLPRAVEAAPNITGSLMGLPAAWARWAAGEHKALDGYRRLIELGDLDPGTGTGAQELATWQQRWAPDEAIARLESTANFYEVRSKQLGSGALEAWDVPGLDLADEVARAHRTVADHLRASAS